MNRTITTYFAALVLLAGAAVGQVHAQSPAGHSGVRDRAKMFSADAIKKADTALENLRGQKRWQVVIETVDSLKGRKIDQAALENAKEMQIHGVYILIDKEKHGIRVEPSNSARAIYTKEADETIFKTLVDAFKAKDYDKGLLSAVALLRKDAGLPAELQSVAEPPTPPAPSKKVVTATPPPAAEVKVDPPAPAPPEAAASGGGVMTLVIIGAVVLVGLFLISRIFRRPAMPQGYANPMVGGGYQQPRPQSGPNPGYPQQPGYGPPQQGFGYAPPPPQGGGGGGFISGALGGLGGAVVGNILYDKFGRPHEGPTPHQGNAPPSHEQGTYQDSNWQQAPTPQETYDPNAGAGGTWTEDPAAPGDSGSTGGDWGAAPDDTGNTGGDWGGGSDQGGGGGDWGGGDAGSDSSQQGDW